MLVDRRLRRPPSPEPDSSEDEETRRRIRERWAYDESDEPVVGPEGHDEHGRKLVDDYSPS